MSVETDHWLLLGNAYLWYGWRRKACLDQFGATRNSCIVAPLAHQDIEFLVEMIAIVCINLHHLLAIIIVKKRLLHF